MLTMAVVTAVILRHIRSAGEQSEPQADTDRDRSVLPVGAVPAAEAA
jgi:hypothetical protein